jgi:hypothetical protein
MIVNALSDAGSGFQWLLRGERDNSRDSKWLEFARSVWTL